MRNQLISFATEILKRPFVKFVFTGGLNTVFGYAVFSAFEYFTGNPSLSVVLANIIGVLFNFKTYGKFVFDSKDNSRIYRFFGVYVFVTIGQIFSLKLLRLLGVANPYIAAAIITVPMAALSFVLMRKFVFHQKLTFETPPKNPNEVD